MDRLEGTSPPMRGLGNLYVMWHRCHIRNSRRRRNNGPSNMGHGGMGKTILLQHVYEDEMAEEFDLKKKWAYMLVCLKNERSRLDESLDALQNSLRTEIMPKKKMTFERRRRTRILANGRKSSPLWPMGKMGLEENECLQHLNSHAFATTP
ncbi:hypothetical protein IEQ34_016887 [Dendrobium chrysotoxum]|uniref:Uncharacterized protein n=1 Tax=Dendrobium chrysotoxum TaxID=161865 RepID=A0AAV7GGV3_DENCH|nr:hypothetical protein IEQ34_016887 [Dendrobium chrysotoxum]